MHSRKVNFTLISIFKFSVMFGFPNNRHAAKTRVMSSQPFPLQHWVMCSQSLQVQLLLSLPTLHTTSCSSREWLCRVLCIH